MEAKDIAIIEKHLATWSERNEAIRLKNIPEIYTADLKVTDPHFIAEGHHPLNDLIKGLQSRFPSYSFTLRKPIEQHHNVARIFWQLGNAEKPDIETGMDVCIMAEGKIQTLIVFIDRND